MLLVMILLFWFFAVIVVYVYFGYPLVLLVLSRYFNRGRVLNHFSECVDIELPKVDLVIAAFNEEKVIENKVLNSVAIDYPPEKLNIYVVSDGSEDSTNDIVKRLTVDFSNVFLMPLVRMGKSAALNTALKSLGGEFVVFSDANTEFEPRAIRRLIRNFRNEDVGCVCGRLLYRNPGQILSGVGESFYWRYETFLKKAESIIGYIAGANGAIYAIRRRLFVQLPSNTINDDFTVSMKIVENGFKSVYDESAIGYEDVAPSMESEFRRHVRDAAGHYIAIPYLTKLLNPFLGLRSFIYLSHRVFRWCVPFILLLLLALNIALLDTEFYRFLFFGQLSFYFLALLGLVISRYSKLPFIFYIPFYFCNLNCALFIGFYKAVFGLQKSKWSPIDRSV